MVIEVAIEHKFKIMFINVNIYVTLVLIFRMHAVNGMYEVNGVNCGLVEMPNLPLTRIDSGVESLPGKWPFLGALHRVDGDSSNFFCGGTLISNKHILTAAHCIQGKGSQSRLAPESIKVLLGTHNITERNSEFSKTMGIAEVHIHPDWDVYSDRYDADIAILVLNEYVPFTNYIRPVCLPADDAIIVGANGFIAGWGLKENGTGHQEVQREGKSQILDKEYCLSTYVFLASLNSKNLFCGGGSKVTPNKGDSGGGFFVESSSAWIQFGVISVLARDGKISTDVNTGALYTNVTSFKNWIVQKTGILIISTVGRPESANEINFTCLYRELFRTWYVSNFDVKIKNVYVASFTGVDRFGQSPEDLRAVAFENGTLYSLPDGIGKAFTNLKELHVGKSLRMKVIRRSSFEDMESLSTLIIGENDIVTFDKDTLWDLANLKEFSLNQNKLKDIHEKTFERNTHLIYVDLDENELEYLPRKLFQNNAMLTAIHFRANRLRKIEVNFSSLMALEKVDFYANRCVSAFFLLSETSIEELQTAIQTKCSG